MAVSETNRPVDLSEANLVDLASYRKSERIAGNKPDPLIVLLAYARDDLIYQAGRIVAVDKGTYACYKRDHPNELVNKFGVIYADGIPMLLQRKLADVLISTAIDLRDRYRLFTIAMDGLRTYDSGVRMQESRPDLVALKLLALAGTSAHNRALAVDSKLFELVDASILDAQGAIRPDAKAAHPSLADGILPLSLLAEADEKGHLDDMDMVTNHRFYQGDMSDAARENRLRRLQAWQRAAVKHRVPVANLLAEFWDDRTPGSPQDMWRVLAVRALALELDSNPKSNLLIANIKATLEDLHRQQQSGALTRETFAQQAYEQFTEAWGLVFSNHREKMEFLFGPGGGEPPALADFIPVFHEWQASIYDDALAQARGFRQATTIPAASA